MDIKITSEELALVRYYADFNRTVKKPCLITCSPKDRAACCGCAREKEYEKQLLEYSMKIEPIKNIIDNPYIKKYIEAYNTLCESDSVLREAERRSKIAKDIFNSIENTFIITDKEESKWLKN